MFPCYRPVDTPQSYTKGGSQSSQTVSRSAASPLSPQRQGSATTYPPYSGVHAREAPIRYVQQNSYATVPFRENPYARVPQVPQQVDYHRATPVVTVPNSLSISHGGSTIEPTSSRPRISLLPHSNEYLPARQQQPPPEPGGPPSFKKIRLTENQSQSPPPLLKVDVREPPSANPYQPQVENVSPIPQEEFRVTKDELLQKISKVDMEISKAEKTIAMLKKKEASLEEVAAKPVKTEENPEVQPKHRNLAQQTYAENRKKASIAHQLMAPLGPFVELPLYNQPSDVEACKEVMHRHQSFKSRILLNLSRAKTERSTRNKALADKYAELSQEWSRRVEKIESSAKRKAKEAKNRDFFEKVYTEIRKQREDKERFNRVGSRIKSEADLEEIMDGLQEQVSFTINIIKFHFWMTL